MIAFSVRMASQRVGARAARRSRVVVRRRGATLIEAAITILTFFFLLVILGATDRLAPTGFAGMLAHHALPSRESVSLRLVSSAGEALPAELGQRFERHPLAGPDRQADVLQNRHIRPVMKSDVVKRDRPAQPMRGSRRAGAVMNLRHGIENIEDPLAGGQGMLQHVIDGMNLIDRHIEQRQIRQKENQLSEREPTVHHFTSRKASAGGFSLFSWCRRTNSPTQCRV